MQKYIILILFSILSVGCLSGCDIDDSYRNLEQARQDVFNYFSENQNILEENKDLILKNHSLDGISIEKINQIKYYNNIIIFECGNWSMLMNWGEDWGIYYNVQDIPLNTLHIGSGYNEDLFSKTNDGKYYFWVNQNPNEKCRSCVSERITKNWFFYYNEWEGDLSLQCQHIVQ